jgi:hypothetical protein
MVETNRACATGCTKKKPRSPVEGGVFMFCGKIPGWLMGCSDLNCKDNYLEQLD